MNYIIREKNIFLTFLSPSPPYSFCDIFDIRLRKLLIFILLISNNFLVAEEKPGPFIARIISYPSPVLVFNFQSAVNQMPIHLIKDLPPTFKFSGQTLTKNRNGLFLNHLGTGRIYQWKGDEHIGKWVRIDSTFFTGYNFLSLFFSVDTTLYSFGGIGFWHINGNLRRYNSFSGEWNIKRLNNSIPWIYHTDQLFYIDTAQKKLYINGQGLLYDAGIKADQVDSSTLKKMYCLDIEKGSLVELGKYQSEAWGFFGQTPWGTVVSYNELVDFKNNKCYKLSRRVENNLYRLLANSTSSDFVMQYSFWLDSALYFTFNNQKYDSVIIKQSDLISTDKTFYYSTPVNTPEQHSSESMWRWMVSICIAIMISTIFIVKYVKKKTKSNQTENKNHLPTNESFVHEQFKFTEVELNLIKTIFENSILKKMTTINEINNILGCSNKNIEIQKRLRSDSINTINQKCCMNLLVDYKIIQRMRSDFDRRSFEYYIDEKHLQQVSKLLA